MQMVAPATTGALWMPRRGTSSACAKRTHSTWRRPKSVLPARGHVLHSVQRPVHVIVIKLDSSSKDGHRKMKREERGAVSSVSRSGKPAQAGGTGTGAEANEQTNARLAACHRFSRKTAKVVRDASEKEGGHGLRPCEETRAPVSCPYVVFSCRSRQAESWPRISSHAALQKEWR
jgi:hypothetical protein